MEKTKGKYKRNCKICNKFFIANHPHAKLCSDICRIKWNKLKYNYQITYKPKELFCPICKIKFRQNRNNQIYCCKECCLKAYNTKKSENNWYLRLRFEVFKKDNFTCQYCGRNIKQDKIKLHCDHIIPKALGGSNKKENLITSCKECNLGKGDILLVDFNPKHSFIHRKSKKTKKARKSM